MSQFVQLSDLPQPTLPAHPEWEELYWRAWELGFASIREGTLANGFASRYADAAFGGNIFQWDTCFMAAFARYGREMLPIYPALDHFYARQEPDGYIAREYRGENGASLWAKPSADSCNPPLFAWAEWLLFQVTNDHARLAQVWKPLQRYYFWLHQNRRLENGLYWTSSLGSGMDNAPRCAAAWTDYSMQQALNALMLSKIGYVLGKVKHAEAFEADYWQLHDLINALMWDDQTGYYWDLDAHNDPVQVRTIAPFWALLAGIGDQQQTQTMLTHLRDPEQFWRAHPFPTLAANEREYVSTGNYWRGSVWAPTNYAVIRGLQQVGAHDLARQATTRHLDSLAHVVRETGTLWENYQADVQQPGLPARPDFVGWTGLGPIALLIESIFGLELNAPAGRVVWHLPDEECSITNLPFGSGRVDFSYAQNQVRVLSTLPLHLELITPHRYTVDIAAQQEWSMDL